MKEAALVKNACRFSCTYMQLIHTICLQATFMRLHTLLVIVALQTKAGTSKDNPNLWMHHWVTIG
jgi:hypothetical protein